MMDYSEFESLDAADQIKVFQQSSIREKGELLLRSHDPQHLVKSLTQEELYLISKEMDGEERSEVIRYATLPQLFFISDIECWNKDRIDQKGFVEWLRTLKDAGDLQLYGWIFHSDYETIITGFKKVTQVLKAEREYAMDESLGDTPYFTLDDSYFIYCSEEDLETVRRAFEILYENHRGRYFAVLEGIIAEIDDQTEEEAYQARLRRLAERGFPDPETAHLIYRPMNLREFEAFPLKSKDAQTGQLHIPDYLKLWDTRRLFLDDVLLMLQERNSSVYDQVREELAWLANKIISVNGIDFSSEERVRKGIERARAYVSLGLEVLTEKDLDKAMKICSQRWLEAVFRYAVGQIHQAYEPLLKAITSYWQGKKDVFMNFLNPPYEHVVRGLFHLVPEYYDASSQKEGVSHRDFQTLEDVAKTALASDQLLTMMDVLMRVDPAVFAHAIRKLEVERSDCTLFQCLSQFFALFVLGKKLKYRALTRQEGIAFLKKSIIRPAHRGEWDGSLKEAFLKSFFTEAENKKLMPLWSLAFDHLLDEIGGVDPDADFQSEFISALDIR